MENDREDGDGWEESHEAAINARKFLRRSAEESRDPFVRQMLGELRYLELYGSPFFLGIDYDEDRSDVDEGGPF